MESSNPGRPVDEPPRTESETSDKDGISTPPSLRSDEKEQAIIPEFRPELGFYLIFISLMVITLAAALDATSLSVALPIISQKLNGTAIEAFWSGTSFLLTSTVFQPVYASFSHIFGRKPILLFAIALFVVGAIIAAVADNFTVLLIGRSLQGVGGGGILSLSEILVTDLVPLRLRGQWFGFLSMMWAVGSVTGPIIGGAFAQNVSWRWIFWINLPFAGVGFVMILLFLRLNFKATRFTEKLARVDWIGSFLFIASSTSFIIPITWGGVQYPWNSWRTIVPLVLGIIGLLGFVVYERFGAAEPVVRLSVFNTVTSRVTYFQILIHGMILWCILYYLPLYYEAVKDYSPIITGISIFPETFTVAPASVVVGILVTITGRYRWAVWGGWLLATFGSGLLILLNVHTSITQWIFLNLIAGLGTGLLFPALVFAIQASNTSEDTAFAVALASFFRTFGQSLGVAIGGVIFQNRIRAKLLTYPLLAPFADEYSQDASGLVQIIKTMSNDLPQKAQLIQAYADSLKTVWLTICVLSAVALITSIWTEGYDMNVEHKTEQGFNHKEKTGTLESGVKQSKEMSASVRNSAGEK